MSKSHVNYNPNVKNVVINNNDDNTDWYVESWMLEISGDDKEISECLWEVTCAFVRQNVAWNKVAWFFSESGNSGKGTLCAMLRNLLGTGAHCSILLSDISKDFMMKSLTHYVAVIFDENDVGIYFDKAVN